MGIFWQIEHTVFIGGPVNKNVEYILLMSEGVIVEINFYAGLRYEMQVR